MSDKSNVEQLGEVLTRSFARIRALAESLQDLDSQTVEEVRVKAGLNQGCIDALLAYNAGKISWEMAIERFVDTAVSDDSRN